MEKEGRLERRRADRAVNEVRAIVSARLEQDAWRALGDPTLDHLRDDLVARRTDPYAAAEEVLQWQSSS